MAVFRHPFFINQVKPAETPEEAVRKVYDKALEDIALAPQGQRNNTLNVSARTVGRLVAAGLIAEGDAMLDLKSAARGAGLQPWDSEKTIRSGFTSGLLKPWEIETATVLNIPRVAQPDVSAAAEEELARRAEKAEGARALYAGATSVEGSRAAEYLTRRGIATWPDSARYSRMFNGLCLPLTTPAGEIAAVQKIPLNPDGTRGEKKTAGPMGNSMFCVPGKAGPAVVVDGPEDAMSVALATGWRVFGACNKQRFPHVLDHLKAGDRLIAVRDADGTDNSEYDKLRKLATEKRIDLVFTDPPTGKDANDVLRDGGIEAVRAWFSGAVDAAWPQRAATAPVVRPGASATHVAATLPTAFPKHLLHAPGAIGVLTDYITRTARYPQPELALGTTLTLLGALMGRRVKGPTGLRTNIMALGLADSGSGKGHSRDMAKRMLTEIGVPNLLGGDSIRSGAGLVSRLRSEPNTLYMLDEIGMFLSSAYDRNAGPHMREIVTLFTQFFSEAGQTWMGSDYADRKLNAPAPIVQPHMSLFGITNPTSLWNAFGGGALKDGSVARYLVFYPNEMYPDRAKNQLDGETVPGHVLDLLRGVVDDLPTPDGRGNLASMAMADPTPYPVPIAGNARDALEDFEDANVRERRLASGTDRASIIARAVEHAWKISCIAAVADNPKVPLIGLEHAQYGMALASWSTNWLDKQATTHVADSDFGRKLNKVHEILRRVGADGISKSELTRQTQRLLSGTRERDDIMVTLAESGTVVMQMIEHGGRGVAHYWSAECAPRDDNEMAGEEVA
jgi:hypothetical protein